MALFTLAGRGKKQCPKCQVFNSVRNSRCENADFVQPPAEAQTEGQPPAEAKVGCNHIFYEKKVKVKAEGTGGQRGKKRCPVEACQKLVGVRSHTCQHCNHVFSEPKIKIKADAKISDTKGPGRKECQGCHKFVGVRSSTCPVCNQAFEKKAPKAPAPSAPLRFRCHRNSLGCNLRGDFIVPEVQADAPVQTEAISLAIVAVPADPCPVPIRTLTEKNVARWARLVRRAGAEKQEYYNGEALQKFAGEFFQEEELIQAVSLIQAFDATDSAQNYVS